MSTKPNEVRVSQRRRSTVIHGVILSDPVWFWRTDSAQGFCWLQNSVWISPDPLAQEREILGGGKINVESLLLLEARPARVLSPIGWERVVTRPGEGGKVAEIVAGARDFDHLNHRYARHLKVLKERPHGAL